jgi:hypothetical protein
VSNPTHQRTTEMCWIVQDARTCLIWHTKGPGKCVRLYRMSEYSGFILITVFLCLLSALMHRTVSSPKKSGENSSSYLQNAGRFSKTFTAEILIQTTKYCLPQIKYLLIHVFLINFRQGNVKLVLLKEFKPIILDFASEN